MNDYILPSQAAKILAVSPETIRQYAASGKLDGMVRIQETSGGHRRYHRADIMQLKQAGGLLTLTADPAPLSTIERDVVITDGRDAPLTAYTAHESADLMRTVSKDREQLYNLIVRKYTSKIFNSIIGLAIWGVAVLFATSFYSDPEASKQVLYPITAFFFAVTVLTIIYSGFQLLLLVWSPQTAVRQHRVK